MSQNVKVYRTLEFYAQGGPTRMSTIDTDDSATICYWRPETDDTGALYFGDGTKDFDVRFTLGASGVYAEFDVGNARFSLVGVDMATDAPVVITDTTESTSTTTGALIVSGGIANAKDTYLGDDLFLTSGAVINFNNGDVTLTHAANALTFDGGDVLIANGFGQIIGHTAQIAAGGVTSELQMHGTAPADSTMLLAAWSADAVPPRFYFAKSRSATIGTFAIITTGDNLGEILAFGDDGVDFNSNANASCAIIFDSAGTIGADRVPGQILIQTATDAAPSVLTTAVTISAAQLVTLAAGCTVTTGNLAVSAGSILSASATAGMGYATGAGGTVSQGTSKSTGVTLNTATGAITMHNASLAADTTVAFTLTDSAIALTDAVVVIHESAGTIGAYSFGATAAAGSVVISVHNNTPGALGEAIVLRFVVIKSVNA